MRPIRRTLILFLSVLSSAIYAQGQGGTPAPQTANPMAATHSANVGVYDSGTLQQPVRQPSVQQLPSTQQQPIRIQTLQTQPKSITHNGITVYQQPSGQVNHPTAPPDRTMPAGFGSPYTGQIHVASTQTEANRRPGSVYGLPPTEEPTPSMQNGLPSAFPQPVSAPPATGFSAFNPPSPQTPPNAVQPAVHQNQNPQTPQYPNHFQQPGVRIASAQAPVAGEVVQPMNVAPANPVPGNPTTPQPGTIAPPAGEYRHVGRAAPISRIVPFVLDQQQQKELDDLLLRWEAVSKDINRYSVEFTAYIYDPTVPRLDPSEDVNKPLKTAFGTFKFNAPNKFLYHLEGEWIGGAKVKRNEEKSPGVAEEKIIINDQAFFQYDFTSKNLLQINIPAEMRNRGIADSPLPLIFGAKATEMKSRYSMRIVTREEFKDSEVWLQARPLRIEDQQEFCEIEIRLDKRTLQAKAIKKHDPNGKSYTAYVLSKHKINDPLGALDRWSMRPSVPNDWKHIVEDMPVPEQASGPRPIPASNVGPSGPASVHAPVQGGIANPVQPNPNTPRNEIQLYAPPQR